jgi:hypothetical protein
MKRSRFDHTIRAAVSILGESDLLVIGSQRSSHLDGRTVSSGTNAKASGISATSIARYETGSRSPPVTTLARLATAAGFEVTVSFSPLEPPRIGRAFVSRCGINNRREPQTPGRSPVVGGGASRSAG